MAWLPTHVAKPSFNLNRKFEIESHGLGAKNRTVDYVQNLIVFETLIDVMSKNEFIM